MNWFCRRHDQHHQENDGGPLWTIKRPFIWLPLTLLFLPV